MGICLGTLGAGAGASLLTTCACGAASCCVSSTCSLCGKSFTCQKSAATRGVYVFQFILMSVIAYIFSYWAHDWFKDIPVLKGCDELQCYGNLSVYRITFGLAIYHLFLGVFLIGAKSSADWRAIVQDGLWPIKFFVLIGIIVASFFIPNSFFVGYGWVMVIGAGIFIIVQLVLLIEFAYSWNEGWLRKMEDQELEGDGNSWYYLLLSVTFIMIGAGIALTGVMYHFFSRNGCGLNAFFVTINLIMALIYCVLCVVPKVREGRPSSGLLQSAVIFLYTTYLVWSAVMSEPSSVVDDDGGQCNPFSFTKGTKAFSVIMGAGFTIVSVVWSTIRTAGSSDNLLGTSETPSSDTIDVEKPLINTTSDNSNDDDDAMDDERQGSAYNYTFFHLCFCLGAMYICMLLTNWMTFRTTETNTPSSDDASQAVSVDSGMASVWIKIVSGWLTIILYIWSLVAPILLPDRDWN